MEEMILRIGSEESYEAIKKVIENLKDVDVLEELPIISFPFSKDESDFRLSQSMKQFSEGKTISLKESKLRTAQIIQQVNQ